MCSLGLRKRKVAKGSFTIEMGCLMPIFLLVIFVCIYLCFFVHNRAWLTAAAHEAAIVGCQEMRKADGIAEDVAYQRGRSLLSPRLYGIKNLQMQVQRDKKKLNVQFDGDTTVAYGGLTWHLQTAAEETWVDPVGFIWKVKGLQGLARE